ncbi:MAG: hypothetical protein V2J89_06270 [Halieaceae bacterium]|jgi:hypothetical protein|nr:hypothetical protein [Halieaceae bacterium]
MNDDNPTLERTGRNYLRVFLGALAAIALVNLAGLAAFIYEPRNFYYRPWEYFYELAYKFKAYDANWHREQSADLSRQNWFFYQGRHYTDVTTDPEGYRSVPLHSDRYPILVSGDSLVFGSGLSDAETLPWRLALRLDRPVFNGGRSSLANTLKKPELADTEIVIDVRGEPLVAGAVFADYGYKDDQPYRPRVTDEFSRWEVLREVPPQRYLLTSIGGRMLSRLARDLMVLATGERERRYMPYQLSDASMMSAADAIQARSERLKQQGRRYIFVAVPFEQTLYGERVTETQRRYLQRLHQELTRRGVESIDLLDSFLQNRHRPIFQRYDTHWTAEGVDLAVDAIARYLQQTRD